MSRTKLPGLSRERIHVFADTLSNTLPGEKRLIYALAFVLGEIDSDELGASYPDMAPAAIAAQAGRVRPER